MDEKVKFHELAKDAGNRLRSYILSVSSGATGVFFLALTKSQKNPLSTTDKWLLSIALLSFVLTVLLCLYELRVDAKRFFSLAKELEKSVDQRNWATNEKLKKKRFYLIHLSYVSLSLGIAATIWYLILKIIYT